MNDGEFFIFFVNGFEISGEGIERKKGGGRLVKECVREIFSRCQIKWQRLSDRRWKWKKILNTRIREVEGMFFFK